MRRTGLVTATIQIVFLFSAALSAAAETVEYDLTVARQEITIGGKTSRGMTINGGIGDDNFIVFHNLDTLDLFGDAGNDTFLVQAFALAGSQEDHRALTDVSGGGGADLIQYAVNAPVNIDGGDGFDTVRIVGTEFADDFVITDTGVYGAGLNVTYVNIEKLTVDGAEGDDRYFVLSTDPNVVTEIDGGLGNDTFFTGGSPSNAPIYVTSNDPRGYSGITLNSIENTGTNYDGVPIDGISANVADNNEAFIVVNESGGFSSVTEDIPTPTGVSAEGWAYDTYTVTLTKAFVAGEVVNVHVLPQDPSPEELALGAKNLEFWNGSSWVHDTTLTFTSAGTQTVKFRAAHDSAAEGKQFAIINHKVDDLVTGTTPGQYDGIAMRSVKVQINDDDQAGVIVTRTERPLQVIEGNSNFDQTYAVVLTRAPTGSNTVDVTLSSYYGDVTFSGSTLSDGDKLTFNATDYNQAQFVTVTPVDDSKQARMMWGTTRNLVRNMVRGVSQGYSKTLEITGVGYRAAFQGKMLQLQLGYSHDVNFPIPEGITIKCEKPTSITISGADRQRVGQVAAEIRAYRAPEPYKGKGIKYSTETILRKEGKKK